MNLKQFESELKMRKFSEPTIEGYVQNLKDFFKFLNKDDNKYSPTKDDVKNFIIHLSNEKYSVATIHRTFWAIRRFFLHQERAHELNLLADTILPQNEAREVEYLTPEQIKHIFNVCDDLIKNSIGKRQIMYVRDKVVIYTFFISGLRRNELLSLRIDDIDIENKRLKVERSKRRDKAKVGFIPLKDEDIKLYNAWLQIKPKSEWLFPGRDAKEHISESTAWYTVNKIGRIANVPTFPHKFRHSVGSLMASSGYRMEEIANFLGHQSIETTRHFYAALSPEYINRRMVIYRDNLGIRDMDDEAKI